MGRRNVLVDGTTCAGKTAVCEELLRRGHDAVHGDRQLAHQADPRTGAPVAGPVTAEERHAHHVWRVDLVRVLVADHRAPVTFFCGGARNADALVGLFDRVVVLDIDLETLQRRLDARRPQEWGGQPCERELVLRLHGTREGLPRNAVVLDATRPLGAVVDDLVRRATEDPSAGRGGPVPSRPR